MEEVGRLSEDRESGGIEEGNPSLTTLTMTTATMKRSIPVPELQLFDTTTTIRTTASVTLEKDEIRKISHCNPKDKNCNSSFTTTSTTTTNSRTVSTGSNSSSCCWSGGEESQGSNSSTEFVANAATAPTTRDGGEPYGGGEDQTDSVCGSASGIQVIVVPLLSGTETPQPFSLRGVTGASSGTRSPGPVRNETEEAVTDSGGATIAEEPFGVEDYSSSANSGGGGDHASRKEAVVVAWEQDEKEPTQEFVQGGTSASSVTVATSHPGLARDEKEEATVTRVVAVASRDQQWIPQDEDSPSFRQQPLPQQPRMTNGNRPTVTAESAAATMFLIAKDCDDPAATAVTTLLPTLPHDRSTALVENVRPKQQHSPTKQVLAWKPLIPPDLDSTTTTAKTEAKQTTATETSTKSTAARTNTTTATTSFDNPWVTKARLQETWNGIEEHSHRHHQETIRAIYQAQQAQFQQQQLQKQQDSSSSSSSAAPRTMILLSGPCGSSSGKRNLAQRALHDLVEQQGGYFLEGQFDSCASGIDMIDVGSGAGACRSVIPYSGFVTAFSSFTAQVLQRDLSTRHALRESIFQELSGGYNHQHHKRNEDSNNNMSCKTRAANVAVLTSMIPALEGILGDCSDQNTQQQPPRARYGDSIQRFIFAFRMFLRAISSPSNSPTPLVLVLHDLQYADHCCLDLLSAIVTDLRHNLLVICTCDDTRVSPNSYLASKLREMENSTVIVSNGSHDTNNAAAGSQKLRILNVALPRFSSEKEVGHWLAGALDMNNADHAQTLQRLTRLIQRFCCMGNWFLIMEFIQFLQESDLLVYRPNSCIPPPDTPLGRWELASPEELDVVLAHLDRPGEFLMEKLNEQLSEDSKRVLTVAACLGSSIDVEVLGHIFHEKNNSSHAVDIQKCLEELVQLGFLSPIRENDLGSHKRAWACHGLTFQHPMVRHVAKGLIGRNKKDTDSNRSIQNRTEAAAALHLDIGRRLWKRLSSLSEDHLYQHLFVVLSQLHLGRHLITEEKERVATAALCLYAGQKAAKSSTFRTAAVYLKMGIELIYHTNNNNINYIGAHNSGNNQDKGDFGIIHNRCWRDEYDLSLALHRAAAEMTVACADFEKTNQYVERVLINAHSFEDKFPTYITKINALSQQDRHDESLDTGIWLLEQLGETFPRRMCQARLAQELRSVEKLLKNKSNEQICRMPLLLDDSPKLRAMQVLNFMIIPALAFRPKFVPFVMLKMVKITLRYGLSALASAAFSVYGMVLITSRGDTIKATRFAELSLVLLDRFGIMEYLPRVHAAVYGCIDSWTKPISSALEPLLHAHRVGMQIGDAEFGGLCANLYCIYAMDTGFNLEVIRREYNGFKESMVTTKQQFMLRMFLPSMQYIHHLMGFTNDPLAAKGDLLDYDEYEKIAVERGDQMGVMCIKFFRMKLGYIFGDITMAENSSLSFKDVMLTPPTFERATYVFYIGLVAVAVARRDAQLRRFTNRRPFALSLLNPLKSKNDITRHMKDAKKAEKMLMDFARSSPQNCLDQSNLLQAEIASFEGDHCKAYEKYLTAIALAAEHGHIFCHALSNELLGRHLIRQASGGGGWGGSSTSSSTNSSSRNVQTHFVSNHVLQDQRQKAKEYLQRSIQSYRDWGGMAKVQRMQQEFVALIPLAPGGNLREEIDVMAKRR